MSILDYFNKKTSIVSCFIGTTALIVLAAVAGLTVNKFSRHPLPLKQVHKTGIETIELSRAVMLHGEKVLFVDARSPDAFNDGHISGAYNFDYFNFDQYFAGFSKKFERTVSFVVYCEGISGQQNEDTCETSRLLAQQLFDRGYKNVMAFEQGFAFWEKAKYPVDRGAEAEKSGKSKKMPWVNYVRDFLMLALGLAALFMKKKPPVVAVVQILLGIIFIISASSKLFSPEKLAVILEAYRILPPSFVPFVAISMPWVELLAGLTLITGTMPSAGALTVLGMQLFFIPALSYRALFLARQLGISVFNVDFDCGCGLGENFAWVFILRDAGFLLMAAAIVETRLRFGRGRER